MRAWLQMLVRRLGPLIAVLLAIAMLAVSGPAVADDAWITANSDDLDWAGDPDGVQRVHLVGDPAQPGVFVYRVRVPAGFAAPMHHHTTTLRSTILSGEVVFAFADAQRAPATVRAGGFVQVPAGLVHAERATKATVMEVRGVGPSQTVAVQP